MAKDSYHVLLGARSIEKGQAAVQALGSKQLPGIVESVQLDVTNDRSIAAAVEYIEKASVPGQRKRPMI